MTQPYDPQQPYVAPVPPKKTHTFRNVVLVALAVIVIIAIASSAGKKKTDSTPAATGQTTPAGSSAAVVTSGPDGSDPKADVAITACKPGDGGYLGAKVKVTNHSAKPSTYIITVLFESKDGKEQLDTGLVSVDHLANGQVSNQDAAAIKTAPTAGYTCKLGDVTRLAS